MSGYDGPDSETVRVSLTLPKPFVRRIDREFSEGVSRSERVRMAAAVGVTERESTMTEERVVRAFRDAVSEQPVAVRVVAAEE